MSRPVNPILCSVHRQLSAFLWDSGFFQALTHVAASCNSQPQLLIFANTIQCIQRGNHSKHGRLIKVSLTMSVAQRLQTPSLSRRSHIDNIAQQPFKGEAI